MRLGLQLEHRLGDARGMTAAAKPLPGYLVVLAEAAQRGKPREEDCARAGLPRDGRLPPRKWSAALRTRGAAVEGRVDACLSPLGARHRSDAGTARRSSGGCVQLGEKTFHPAASHRLETDMRGPKLCARPHRSHGEMKDLNSSASAHKAAPPS